MGQMGFFDVSNRYASLDARKDPLVQIAAVVPFEEFRSRLEAVWRKPGGAQHGAAGAIGRSYRQADQGRACTFCR